MNIDCNILLTLCSIEADPYILNLSTSWRGVISFKFPSLYSLCKKAPVRIKHKAGCAPEPVWKTWRRKNLTLTGTRNPTPLLSSPQVVAIWNTFSLCLCLN
jgi:hypothetical protein